MPTESKNSYDEVPYSEGCFHVSHPDHLAMLAVVHGIPAPPVERCRLLELGCARGGNLLPMAMELPGATFLGVDLSERQIGEARETAARLGLSNVDLRAMSLTGIDASFGTFDYIVCHGVYSWVPDGVRERILEICSGNLAPNGLAYVSYNTYPGWHQRGLLRELMLFHSRKATDVAERLEKARAFPAELAGALANASSPYASILRKGVELLREEEDTYLFHDYLEDDNQPTYVHEFLTRAGRHGLEFLAEAGKPGLLSGLPASARQAVSSWADDTVSREQYLDFVCNRSFRRTVLRRAGGPPASEPAPEVVERLRVFSALKPVSAGAVVTDDSSVEFAQPEESGSIRTNNAFVKVALQALFEERPATLGFESLWTKVRDRLVESGTPLPAPEEEGRKGLRAALLQLSLSDLVELHVRPPNPATEVSPRPVSSPLARLQAANAARVTNLRRRGVDLAELDRAVLLLLDGTRDLDAVLESLVGQVLSGDFLLSQDGKALRDPRAARKVFAGEVGAIVRRFAASALLAR
jgi:methyltransferase-like protein/2-polyprenyl-3-methyl-5-hydroxy-6-metoxy-1,4-benzoquinol methylase